MFASADTVDPEVPIEREYKVSIEFFGEHDECRVGEIHRQVRVFLDEGSTAL